MSVLEMTFAQYFAELVIIYKVRDLATGDNVRRMLIDRADEVLLAYQEYQINRVAYHYLYWFPSVLL